MTPINTFPMGAGGNIGNAASPRENSSHPGAFRRIIGAAVGIAGNVFAPGVGSAIGQLIGGSIPAIPGGSPNGAAGLLMSDSMQYLQLQQQMMTESRTFEAVSNVLKTRHDAAMAAIRNIS